MKRKSETNGPGIRKRKVQWLMLTTGVAAAALVALIFWANAPTSFAEESEIVVYKTASCSCCKKWVAHLRDAGLKLGVVNVSNTQTIQARVGVPRKLGSCHTALVGDYFDFGNRTTQERTMNTIPKSYSIFSLAFQLNVLADSLVHE